MIRKVISGKNVIEVASRYRVDQNDILESFICELLDIKAEELYAKLGYKDEDVKTCAYCGRKIEHGCMTNDQGDFYVHEECFEKWMDAECGKGNWMALGNGEEDGMGGYYIQKADVAGGFIGTGIYYTEY